MKPDSFKKNAIPRLRLTNDKQQITDQVIKPEKCNNQFLRKCSGSGEININEYSNEKYTH